MALKTESQLIAAINKKIKGAKAKLGGDVEIRRILNEEQGDLRLEIDLISAKRPGVPFILYDDIYEYAPPSDIDYDKGISIIPQAESLKSYLFERVALKYFYQPQNPVQHVVGTRQWLLNSAKDNRFYGGKNICSYDFEDSEPYMLIRNNFSSFSRAKVVQTATVTPADGTGGTWAVADDGANVHKDIQHFKLNASSVAFDSSGSVVDVTVANETFTSVDLSSFEDKGVLHMWVYLPATAPASVTLRWGSSSTSYWDKAVSVRKNGLAFKNGWNLLEFDWVNVDTDTGSPDSSAIDYVQVKITNSAAVAQKDYRIDGIFARLGKAVELQYYSKNLVKASDGTRKEEFTDSSDVSILEAQEVKALVGKCFEAASVELRELKDADRAERKNKERKNQLGQRFPSEKEIEGTTYHRT